MFSFLEFVRRVAGEVSNHTMRIFQIENLEDRIVSGLVLSFYDRVVHAAFLNSHVVLKYGLTGKTNPCIFWRRYRNFNLWILLLVFVNILLVIGAEPQLAILLKAEHKRTAFCLTVTTYGCEILYRVCL